uniref:Uncharacterized protein n=1 Tax=Oryza brachyantha TaxID=4533 RepID=J3NDV3_ORYBR
MGLKSADLRPKGSFPSFRHGPKIHGTAAHLIGPRGMWPIYESRGAVLAHQPAAGAVPTREPPRKPHAPCPRGRTRGAGRRNQPPVPDTSSFFSTEAKGYCAVRSLVRHGGGAGKPRRRPHTRAFQRRRQCWGIGGDEGGGGEEEE